MATRIKKKGKFYWLASVSRTINERTYRKQKTFKTKAPALAWEAELREQLDRGENPFVTETRTTCSSRLIDWATEYLDHANKFVGRTIWEKQAAFKSFFAATNKGSTLIDPDWSVKDLTPWHALKVLEWVKENTSANRANKDRKNLGAAWEYGKKYLGFEGVNPFQHVEKFATQSNEQYTPPEKDFWAVVDSVSGQDKTILLAYYYLAARRDEVFRLKWEDIDFVSRTVRVTSRKNKLGTWQATKLPMIDALYSALKAHENRGIGSEWVFVSEKTGQPFKGRAKWLRRVCDRVGVKPFGYHAVRRLSASVLANANIPMTDIQRILRHKNLATTERYIRGLGSLSDSLNALVTNRKKEGSNLVLLPSKIRACG